MSSLLYASEVYFQATFHLSMTKSSLGTESCTVGWFAGLLFESFYAGVLSGPLGGACRGEWRMLIGVIKRQDRGCLVEVRDRKGQLMT
jgi:hypothetical protein